MLLLLRPCSGAAPLGCTGTPSLYINRSDYRSALAWLSTQPCMRVRVSSRHGPLSRPPLRRSHRSRRRTTERERAAATTINKQRATPAPGADLSSGAGGARVLRQIVTSDIVRNNPAFAPNIASTIDGSGGQAAALSNARSSGVFVQAGSIASAGDLLPGPTGRTAIVDDNGNAVQSGLGELPIISTGNMAAASTYGAGGAAVAVSAPSAYWVGGGTRASAVGDATGLYGGTWAASNSWVGGQLPGMARHDNQFGNIMGASWGWGERSGSGRGGAGRGGGGGGGGRGAFRGDGAFRDSWGDRGYWGGGGGGIGGQTSFAGAQVFESMSYGVSGVGGPVAVAAAGEALAVSQAGSVGGAGAWRPHRGSWD
ncbi:MAG: hypothetical protein J3K34DRAFT_394897 [Monoraphidium minutum]|nr:MAG: hypothetical protein J3K34DRAFT_394897 [Monoraphidium minutum]